MLVYLPKGAKGPAPAFLGLSFRGNQTVAKDPRITLNKSYVLGAKRGGDNREMAEKSRGSAAERWPVELIVSKG